LDAERGAILITGGAGYIGSHAAKALAGAGRTPVVYDDLSAGHRGAVRWGQLVVGNIHDEARLRDTIRRFGVTSVMHFAALASVGDSVRDPAAYYQANVEGSLCLLRAMRAESVHRVVFSSTAAVFGEPMERPITEAHPTRPINPYGETKLVIERALASFDAAYGLRYVVLRYFNAAGADPDGELGEDHRPEDHLVPIAIDAALGRRTLQVYGDDYPTPDGTCLRDYIHVSDLARAHLSALDRLETRGGSGVYNLGNGRPFSVKDVIAAVERVGGLRVPWTVAPRRPGDPAVLFTSSAQIRDELGWEPEISSLDAIVKTAWQWRMSHPHGFEEGGSR
jgi:UDP-glucose-4-epimerase GalE